MTLEARVAILEDRAAELEECCKECEDDDDDDEEEEDE